VLAAGSDPNRDRPRRPRSPRAPARPLTAALAALAQTLRAPRAASAPAASPGERLAATQTRDRPRGRYVGTPPNGPNAVPASTPRAAPHHPWRTTFSARQRRLNATKPGATFSLDSDSELAERGRGTNPSSETMGAQHPTRHQAPADPGLGGCSRPRRLSKRERWSYDPGL